MLSHPTAQARRLRPHQPAILFKGEVTTYEMLDRRVVRAAATLAALGVREGDVVAVWGANHPDWAAAAHALGRLGAILLPLNLRLTDEEIAWQLEHAGARLVLADADRLSRGIRERFRVVPLAEAFSEDESPAIPDTLDPDRAHTILFTSGTTGRPKAVVLTWANQLASATASAAALGLNPRDRWLLAMPMFHVGGLNIVHRCALAQATVILHDRFSPEAMIQAMRDDGASMLSVVPTMLRRMLDQWGDRPLPSSVRAILVGGAPIPFDLVERCPQALPTYGMTEACSHVTLTRLGASDSERASSGTPLMGTDVRIVDEARLPLPTGTPGAIEVRSPTVFEEYLHNPAATAAAKVDGWLRTGDDGYLDAQGCLHVLARRTDLIVSGGENVYPSEIEQALERHPGVAEAAVVGAPDPTWGQVPVAFVVLRDPGLSVSALRAQLAQGLARYKLPRDITVLDALPRLGSGKIDRRTLQRTQS
ncbi:o-succinylbenzoate--CoA ligase [bacterium]|nr:o-succinylbenzoate--CoA ligase [bacterium]